MDSSDVLEIRSYEELTAHEAEILRRVAGRPNGGRLLLLNPLRLLQEVGIRLSDEAIAEWRATAGEGLFAKTGHEAAYDAVAASDPSAAVVTVHVEGLFKRRSLS